jgi:hypothetical protein
VYFTGIKDTTSTKLAQEALSAVVAHENKEKLLGRTVLVGAVSQFETLIAELAHQFYVTHPESLSKAETTITFADLYEYDTIEHARSAHIAKHVDGLMRASLQDWSKFFKKQANKSIEEITADSDRFNEIFQRRNIIVHEDGRVNKIYLRQVKAEKVKELLGDNPLGQEIPVDVDYVSRSIEELEAVGVTLGLLSLLAWNRQHAQEVYDFVISMVYGSMCAGHWVTAERISNVFRIQNCKQIDHLVLTVNYWLCRKRLDRHWRELRKEVESADLSALHPRFTVARLALLDDFDGFFAAIIKFDGAGISEKELDEWPILEEARKEARFEEVRSRAHSTMQHTGMTSTDVAAASTTLPVTDNEESKNTDN